MNLPFINSEIFLIGPTEEILRQSTGENARGVMVIAQTGEGADVGEKDLLTKILNSVQISLERDAILLPATPATRISLSALGRATSSHTALLFGGTMAQYGLHFRAEKYRPFHIQDLRGIWADELREIGNSRELKTALWNGLKELFLK